MDEVKGGGPLPPRHSEASHSQSAAAAHASSHHLIDRIAPSRATEQFFQAIPRRNDEGGYTNSSQFKGACGILNEEIIHRARSQGLPSSVKVDLSAIYSQLEADPSLAPSPLSQQRVEYLIESTTTLLIEIYHNCQTLEPRYGPLSEIKCTDGDPHNGKRPCFLTFTKASTSWLPSFLTSPTESRFVYKPRNMAIEQATLSPERSLFQSLNALCLETGLFEEPPLRTRTIICGENWGLHEFVPGEYRDPKIHGIGYTVSVFGKKLLAKGFDKESPFYRYIFLEEVIRHCGLGPDAHIGNFIFNADELYAEPIDLEVYNPHESEHSIMTEMNHIVKTHFRGVLSPKVEHLIDQARTTYRRFLATDGRQAVDNFRTAIQDSRNPYIRCVPLSTSLLGMYLNIADNEEEFASMLCEELKDMLPRLGYEFTPPTTLGGNLMRCYLEKNIPLFQLSHNGEFVYYEEESIARKLHRQS